jgi:integration host factor subunit alpha
VSQPWIDRVRGRSASRIRRPPKNILAEEFLLAMLLPSDHYVILNERDGEFMAVTKADLAQKVADDCGFMGGDAAELVDRLLGIMKETLAAGEDVMISGFGKWTVKDKHARRGRNPQTGEALELKARRVITWQYSPVLKRACNRFAKK